MAVVVTLQIIWDKHVNLVIRDIHEKWHDRVIQFMVENHFRPHRLFSQLNMAEEEEEQYIKYLKHILRDECSIVVMDENTNDIFAVAMLKWMTKEWRSWVILPLVFDECKLAELMFLSRGMVLDYAENNPEKPFDSLHLFEYYICDELKDSAEFMVKFFDAICKVAQHMHMPRITFVALSLELQEHAVNVGLTELSLIIYSLHLVKNTRPFHKLRDIGEMNAILYEKPVAKIVPYHEMTVSDYVPH